jgi:hypothetical protein
MFNVGEADFLPADWVWSSILKPNGANGSQLAISKCMMTTEMWFNNGLWRTRFNAPIIWRRCDSFSSNL